MGTGGISGMASLGHIKILRYITPSLHDPVDFYAIHLKHQAINITVLPGWGRHWNFYPPQCLGPRPQILDRYISLGCLHDCRQRTTSDSHIFIGLSGSRDWSHGESHGPDRPMPAAILENFHCKQPCYGFLGLLTFLCSQTLPNLVNCFLIIFSLVWHPKDFAQIKITHGKNASNPSNRSAIVKSFSLCLTSHH